LIATGFAPWLVLALQVLVGVPLMMCAWLSLPRWLQVPEHALLSSRERASAPPSSEGNSLCSLLSESDFGCVRTARETSKMVF